MESDEDDPPYGFQTCPICMDEDDGTIWMTACCGNTIHEQCYSRCVQRYHSCPFCREPDELDLENCVIDVRPRHVIVFPRNGDFVFLKYLVGISALGFASVCGTIIFHLVTI
jgi:hypothetical protein